VQGFDKKIQGFDKKVLVFRSNYLPVSETFISDHLRSLTRYKPVVLCERRIISEHLTPITPYLLYKNWLGKKLFNYLGKSNEFSKVLSTEQPDLVHAHFLTDAVKILPIMENTNIPFVVTAHGWDAATYDEDLKKSIEGSVLVQRRERLIRRVDKIICVSDLIKEYLIENGYPERKLTTCHLGVDLAELTKDTTHEPHTNAIVTVGRLVEKKGTEYLIQAYAKLPAELRQKSPLYIIGDGPLRGELESLAQNLNVKVSFLGALQRSQVLKTVRSAAVFVLPSVRALNGDSEGMPIAIMEALAFSIPVCIFENQPIGNLLEKHEAGLVAAYKDPADLAKKIEALLTNQEYAQLIAKEGLSLAKSHFDLFNNTVNLETIYDQAVAEFTQ
jgi:glycosyltransferase involved in cell wall biosynthesis